MCGWRRSPPPPEGWGSGQGVYAHVGAYGVGEGLLMLVGMCATPCIMMIMLHAPWSGLVCMHAAWVQPMQPMQPMQPTLAAGEPSDADGHAGAAGAAWLSSQGPTLRNKQHTHNVYANSDALSHLPRFTLGCLTADVSDQKRSHMDNIKRRALPPALRRAHDSDSSRMV